MCVVWGLNPETAALATRHDAAKTSKPTTTVWMWLLRGGLCALVSECLIAVWLRRSLWSVQFSIEFNYLLFGYFENYPLAVAQ